MGVSHWNKFHASVLMNRRLMEKVGGYDPAIPWGLEDWNFWLRGSVHNPIVRFVPEITFFYRHHEGTSMRKKMFAMYLEQTKVGLPPLPSFGGFGFAFRAILCVFITTLSFIVTTLSDCI